jgi:hypothetical protein
MKNLGHVIRSLAGEHSTSLHGCVEHATISTDLQLVVNTPKAGRRRQHHRRRGRRCRRSLRPWPTMITGRHGARGVARYLWPSVFAVDHTHDKGI